MVGVGFETKHPFSRQWFQVSITSFQQEEDNFSHVSAYKRGSEGHHGFKIVTFI